jgi:hypothetical protein
MISNFTIVLLALFVVVFLVFAYLDSPGRRASQHSPSQWPDHVPKPR